MDQDNPNPLGSEPGNITQVATMVVSEPIVTPTTMSVQSTKKPKKARKILIFSVIFLLFACAGFVGYRLVQKTPSGAYLTYVGKGPFSFDYPKDWVLKEEDTTSKDYGAYKVTISTPDYTAQKGEDEFSEITTKGYRFTVYYSKNDEIIKDTDAMFDYLTREKAAGLKKLETPNGIVLVQSVGQPSAFIAYSHNSSTRSFYVKDNYDYTLLYDYPDRKDFIPDETYIKQYNHFLSTFREKK